MLPFALGGQHADLPTVHITYRALLLGQDQPAGISGGQPFHAGAHQRSLGLEQGDRLALHVGPHQRPVGVVMLQEGNQRCRDAHQRRGGDLHELHFLRRHGAQLLLTGANLHLSYADPALLVQRRGRRSDAVLLLLIGHQPFDLPGGLALLDPLIGRFQKAIIVDTRISSHRGDQADILSFGGFDGANAIIVGRVNVADLQLGASAAHAAAQGAQAPFMGQFGQGIDLFQILAELSGVKEPVHRPLQQTGGDQVAQGLFLFG